MNRYTNLTPSTYNPLSMQEIMMTPLAMRKQHDDLLAQQEAVRAGLAKVDPDKKHFNEAIQLKKGIEDKINQSAQKLAQEGFSNNMMGETIALNREYNDLVSPTGKIGQINNYKLQKAKIINDYEELAAKQHWTPAETNTYIQEALNKHLTEVPSWDENGQIVQFDIDKNIPTRFDYFKEFDALAKSAGMTTEEFAEASSKLLGPDVSGYNAQQTKSYATKKGKNAEQLDDALKMFVMRINDPTDAMTKSADYEQLDKQKLLEKLGIQKNVYKNDISSTESSTKIDHFGNSVFDDAGKENATYNAGETDPEGTVTVGGKDGQVDFSSIGGIIVSNQPIDPKDTAANQKFMREQNAKNGKKRTYKEAISDPNMQQIYKNTYDKLVKNGKINKNISINDPKAAAKIQFYINNHMPPVTLSSKIIMTDQKPSSDMFMGEMKGKEAGDRDDLVQKYISKGYSKIINPEDGKPMSTEEFNKKGWKLKYDGYESPLNFKEHSFQDPDQNIMAHSVRVFDSEGKMIGNTVVSRTDSEKNTREFKASKIINNVYKRAVLNSGEWTYVSTKGVPANDFKKTAIKYNENGSVDIKKNDGSIERNLDVNSIPIYIYQNYKE